MRLGISIVGQFMGIKPDEGFGSQLRIRTGAEYTRGGELKPGREENVDFFPFDPKTGDATLPQSLRQGDFVVCEVVARSKGYRSADRGIGGMTLYTLESISVIDDAEFQRVAAEDLLASMSVNGGDGA